MAEMNVLVSINCGYLTPLKAMLHSLFLNNKDSKINLFLIHSELTEKDVDSIRQLSGCYGASFNVYVAGKKLSDLSDISKAFPAEAFYRLFAADFLPLDIKRVLYLDSDIIVNGSLKDLYGAALTGADESGNAVNYMFAAAEDYVESYPSDSEFYVGTHKRVGLPNNYKYINSGVLLINLELFRLSIKTDMLISIIHEVKQLLRYADQDLINMMFHKYITYLDYKRYNLGPIFFPNSGRILENEPSIIHFVGSPKPWADDFPTDSVFRAEAKQLYEKYANMAK